MVDIVGFFCGCDVRWIIGCVISVSGGGIKIG